MTQPTTTPAGTDTAPSRPGGGGGGEGGTGHGGRPMRPARPTPPFWRRRPFLVGGAVILIVAIAVITDIPLSSTPATRRSDAAALIKEIATDVAGCSAALRETFTIYHKLTAGTLTAGQRGEAPSILSDDANGCSYTNQSIVDLASLGLPQVSIGKPLSHIAGRVLAWADPDGLTAVYDVSTLLRHPHQARAAADLRRQLRHLASDRAAALADEHHLATQVGGSLPPLGLRVVHA